MSDDDQSVRPARDLDAPGGANAAESTGPMDSTHTTHTTDTGEPAGTAATAATAATAEYPVGIVELTARELAALDDAPLAAHPEAYSRVHAALQRELAQIDSA